MSEPGGQEAAAVAAGCDQRHALRGRGVLGAVYVAGAVVVDELDQLVLEQRQGGRALAPVARALQNGLRLLAGVGL